MAELIFNKNNNKEIREKIKDLQKEILKYKMKCVLAYPEPGDTFKFAGITWTYLDRTQERGYLCVGDCVGHSIYDFSIEDPSWNSSYLRNLFLSKKSNNEKIHDFLQEIEKMGNLSDSLLIFPRESKTLSGDYADIYTNYMDNLSLLTYNEYIKYKNFLPEDFSSWLLTLRSCSKSSQILNFQGRGLCVRYKEVLLKETDTFHSVCPLVAFTEEFFSHIG